MPAEFLVRAALPAYAFTRQAPGSLAMLALLEIFGQQRTLRVGGSRNTLAAASGEAPRLRESCDQLLR